MLLAIDVGNTLTDFGFHDGEKFTHIYKTKSKLDKSEDEYLASLKLYMQSENIDPKSIDAIVISSVVPSLEMLFSSICKELFHIVPKTLGPGLKSGVMVKTDNPKEVGADLIADAIGAKAKYGPNTIIVDMGTATKVILLDSSCSFAGCIIAPGLLISLEALVGNAALLHEVAFQIPNKILGKNTADSINSALTYGTAFQIRGLVDALEKEVGAKCKRVLTGGYASYVKPLLSDYAYDETLLLDGLVALYERNKKQ